MSPTERIPCKGGVRCHRSLCVVSTTKQSGVTQLQNNQQELVLTSPANAGTPILRQQTGEAPDAHSSTIEERAEAKTKGAARWAFGERTVFLATWIAAGSDVEFEESTGRRRFLRERLCDVSRQSRRDNVPCLSSQSRPASWLRVLFGARFPLAMPHSLAK